MADLEGWDGHDRRRVGGDRRRSRPMRRGLLIHKTDGTVADVPLPPVVLVNFEQQFRTGASGGLYASEGSSTKSLWMAFEAERLCNGLTGTFEDYVKTVVALDSWEEPLPLAPRFARSISPGSASAPE